MALSVIATWGYEGRYTVEAFEWGWIVWDNDIERVADGIYDERWHAKEVADYFNDEPDAGNRDWLGARGMSDLPTKLTYDELDRFGYRIEDRVHATHTRWRSLRHRCDGCGIWFKCLTGGRDGTFCRGCDRAEMWRLPFPRMSMKAATVAPQPDPSLAVFASMLDPLFTPPMKPNLRLVNPFRQFGRNVASATIGLRLRFAILKRDGYRCQLCGATAQDGVKLEVDHKVPKSKGGPTVMENLWALCFPCNRGKGVETL